MSRKEKVGPLYVPSDIHRMGRGIVVDAGHECKDLEGVYSGDVAGLEDEDGMGGKKGWAGYSL